jgi:hypothetical protein
MLERMQYNYLAVGGLENGGAGQPRDIMKIWC